MREARRAERYFILDQPGETAAIVGGTGAGKSTLVGLLPRLHNPPRGTVFIDGATPDIPSWSCVPRSGSCREPFLFSDTLAANVSFSVPIAAASGADRGRCRRRAAREGRPGFSSGYATMVGERGITLSGQKRVRDCPRAS
jgi:ABC-type multidrug transport system fused ATPase/permease subunit